MKRNLIVLILGKKGSGKSEFVKTRIAKNVRPLVILDPMMEYTEYGDTVCTGEDFEAVLLSEPGPSCVVIQDGPDGFDEALEICFDLKPHTIVIEEIHRMVNPWKISEPLENLVRMGRHRQINIIGVSHGARDIPETFLSQVDRLVCFQQMGIRDLQKIDLFTDDEIASRIRALPPYKYISVDI